ncbi:transcription/translation regulatory transformer protein RfaH [Vibrio gallicus]|uniref:transcription/translation regulatory transformer protein RfaH n=1 Tax=Vibrio gallicus TaxID=190897 RepID=UPI0021C4B788|nr:transcription/translation regulatory transformer protein RfaH [Vibrio gallicus]
MKRWYLLYCKRGEQQRAKMHLENQGVEVYYPQVSIEKCIRGNVKITHEPLFPGYMFVRFDYEIGPSFTTVRSTRGVADFVRGGVYPKELQGDLVYTLKQLEPTQTVPLPEAEVIDKGTKVTITSGQFAGVDAIYHEPDGEKRSILLVTLISKQVEVHIDNQDIEKK